jgi:protein arginine kinase
MRGQSSRLPDWVVGNGPDADVAVSTRARLARSIVCYPFPSRASGEDLTMVAREVRAASIGLVQRFPDLYSVTVDNLSEDQKTFLLDAHLASREHLRGGQGRTVILDPSARLAIMVNEEDHLRLQVILPGLVPLEAWKLVDWADDVFAAKLNYGFSEQIGYLTADPSNVGTGLRVSVMLHLAGLANTRKVKAQLRAAYDLGVSIRGCYGEGTRSLGDLFQVSNEKTLGLSELEIVERVTSVAEYLLREERRARKELLAEEGNRIKDWAVRAISALTGAISIGAEQAMNYLSVIRLAGEMGLLVGYERRLMNELLVAMRFRSDESLAQRQARTSVLRSKLMGININA